MRSLWWAAGAVFLAGQAAAQEVAPEWTVEARADAVSDYRYRGVSLSDEQPALQADVTVSSASGLYAYGWASTIDEYVRDDLGYEDGGTVELQLSAGYNFEALGYVWDVAVARYIYPGAEDLDYWEIPVSVERAIGPLTLTAGAAYAPEQTGTFDQDNLYGFLRSDWEIPSPRPITLTASIGLEDGAFGDNKTDWSLGASTQVGRADFGLAYVDADAPGVSGAAVASIGLAF